jgi:uncharacterized membrane protein
MTEQIEVDTAEGQVKVVTVNASTGLGTASLVLGIIAICFAWIPFINFLVFLPAVVSAVLGGVAIGMNKGKNQGIAGLIMGILSIIIFVAMYIS